MDPVYIYHVFGFYKVLFLVCRNSISISLPLTSLYFVHDDVLWKNNPNVLISNFVTSTLMALIMHFLEKALHCSTAFFCRWNLVRITGATWTKYRTVCTTTTAIVSGIVQRWEWWSKEQCHLWYWGDDPSWQRSCFSVSFCMLYEVEHIFLIVYIVLVCLNVNGSTLFFSQISDWVVLSHIEWYKIN